ncbi:hypothetical protein J6590_073119 [Homalodisca vitripennis]|nr:hypothetical protein J6590_073119 [Homalodisca vitripennis]
MNKPPKSTTKREDEGFWSSDSFKIQNLYVTFKDPQEHNRKVANNPHRGESVNWRRIRSVSACGQDKCVNEPQECRDGNPTPLNCCPTKPSPPHRGFVFI